MESRSRVRDSQLLNLLCPSHQQNTISSPTRFHHRPTISRVKRSQMKRPCSALPAGTRAGGMVGGRHHPVASARATTTKITPTSLRSLPTTSHERLPRRGQPEVLRTYIRLSTFARLSSGASLLPPSASVMSLQRVSVCCTPSRGDWKEPINPNRISK